MLFSEWSGHMEAKKIMTTLNDTLALVKSNARVCPQPQKWNQLYDSLPNRRRVGNGWEPAVPLILAAWWDTSDIAKIGRLQEHIEWAAQHGALNKVHEFLASLGECDWHHVGE